MRVLADGCFDPLHVGHIRYLRQAEAYSHVLIVRVAPDEAIKAKGRGPFQGQSERMETIMALDMVYRVVAHDSLANAVTELKPRWLVKGSDWRGKLPEDVLKACQESGTEIVYTDTMQRRSSERLAAQCGCSVSRWMRGSDD